MAQKKRGLDPAQWADVRRKFETGTSYAALSREYDVRRHTIADRARRESWTVQPSVHLDGPETVHRPPGVSIAKTIQKRAQADVIDIATRRALEAPDGRAAIEAAAQAVAEQAEELVATVTAARKAAEYMTTILDEAIAGNITPASSPGEQTVADVAKAVMNAYATFTRTVRENSGLRPGVASIPKDEARAKGSKVRFRIVHAPTGTEG